LRLSDTWHHGINTGWRKDGQAIICKGMLAQPWVHRQHAITDNPQIAAAGLKPPGGPQTQRNKSDNIQKHTITSAPRDVIQRVDPSTEPNPTPLSVQPKKLVQLGEMPAKEFEADGIAGPEVHVHGVDGTSQQAHGPIAASGLLAPAASEDSNTQVSSSSGSAKPPSLDGKSVASGTTFALDEKESLRPDDSASVKAADDEDVFSPPSSGIPGSRMGSDDGVRAFRDQLREISSMEPTRCDMAPQSFRPPINPQQGVLYVPPTGLGVDLVPTSTRGAEGKEGIIDCMPDPKLLEALESPRDRIWVLKLEQDISDFVKDPKEASLNLPQCNAYHRMLAHKIADYYTLGHIVDDSASAVRLYKTPEFRLPPPLTGIITPSTAASTPPPTAPQMKILRRGIDTGPVLANGSNIPSKGTSENGDDDKPKLPASREEREARYEAARLRIMGSAKPSEFSPDQFTPKDDSRSSSAAGKKSKKKQRPDDDDGFEARSAYSAYYTPPYSSNGYNSTSYGFPAFSEPSHGQSSTPSNFDGQGATRGYQPYSAQSPAGAPWATQGYPTNGAQPWGQPQQQGYDLSANFQQAMSFQSPVMPSQASNMPAGYESGYQQQYYGAQQPWLQQGYQPQTQNPSGQANNTFYQGYQQRPQSSSSQAHDGQPYLFGQLPSATLGRPPSKLEHPLPGSYKGKHFNPQSQAFVPGQQNGTLFRSFSPQDVVAGSSGLGGGSAFGVPSPLQRQPSAQSHASGYASPRHTSGTSNAPHAQQQTQPMMHPLPQPVFPRQPSPSLPLPPKPGSTPQKLVQQQQQHQQQAAPSPGSNAMHATNGTNQSSIAKWGTPASLPAKPPPPAEPFDPTRFPQLQRQPSYNAAAAARVPSGGMPSFGSIPPMAGGLGVSGVGGQRQ